MNPQEQARSAETAPNPIRRIAVIGAGDRGRAFALRCAAAGFQVVLQDVLSSRLRRAEEHFAHASPEIRDQVQLAESIEDAVRAADVAIDFVPDELESKLEIFSLLDRMAPPKTILCTPTTLSISDLASCTYRADRCVALAGDMSESSPSMQLILGGKTDQAIAHAVVRWLSALGCRVTSINDERVLP